MSDWLMSHKTWVRERYAEGDVTAVELTDMYNLRFGMSRSVYSVTSQIRGIHPKKWTSEQDRWLKMHRDGKLDDICVKFNEKFGTYRTYEAIKERLSYIRREIKRKYGEDICIRR